MGFGLGIGRYIDKRKRVRREKRAVRAVSRPLPSEPVGLAHELSTELIVSLTSFPARFDRLKWTIRSLIDQSVRPDKICLWIAPEHVAILPPDVWAFCHRHDVYVMTARDIGPGTKLIPALREFPTATIVTADDDFYYPPDWLKVLCQGAKANPGAIVCRRAHLARTGHDGKFKPYSAWEAQTKASKPTEPGTHIFPTGVGGVLYPPQSLAHDVLDDARLLRLTPKADDVWFFWMARLAGTAQVRVGEKLPMVNWPGSQAVGLVHGNVGEAGNDKQVVNMEHEFGVLTS